MIPRVDFSISKLLRRIKILELQDSMDAPEKVLKCASKKGESGKVREVKNPTDPA